MESLSVSKVFCCAACKSGFTGGAARLLVGDIQLPENSSVAPVEPSATGVEKRLQVHLTCEQETYRYEQRGGASGQDTWTLIGEVSLQVIQPETGKREEKHPCPICGRELTFRIKSLELARRDVRKAAILALLGIPLFLPSLSLVVHLDARGGALWGALFIATVITGLWSLVGIISFPDLFSSGRQKSVKATHCVQFAGDKSNEKFFNQKFGIWASKWSKFTVSHKPKPSETKEC